MHRFILIFAFGLLSSDVRAGWVLGTNIPTLTPLKLDAGATSDPIFVNVGMSGNSEPNIVAWQFRLVIVSLGGATGTVQFESPLTGSVANPANYLFGNGTNLGISVTNTGSQHDANDFDFSTGGTTGNLLQLQVKASSDATGSFGIFAQEGSSNTLWSDANGGMNYFTNVPNGTDRVLIGRVDVAHNGVSVVPEPFTILQIGMGVMSTLFLVRKKRNKGSEVSSIRD